MGRTILACAAFALTLGQAGSQAYTGTWTAELKGTIYVRLEISLTGSALGGRISFGNIHLDPQGQVSEAEDAPREFIPIFDIVLRESILSFSRKDGRDTDHFEMRLLGNEAAELKFLPSEADLKELAESGIAAPKPIRLKKTAQSNASPRWVLRSKA